MSGLNQLKLLVTRPSHQSAALCQAITEAGGIALPLPLLDIEKPTDVGGATSMLEQHRTADWWIFTSPNAVTWALRLSPPTIPLPWPPRLAATGYGTGRALQASLPQHDILIPATDGASGLLRMPEFHRVSGRPLLIVRGERPLRLLEDGLQARGASLATAEVYRRRPRAIDPVEVGALIQQADAAIITSGESLRALRHLTPAPDIRRLLSLQLVVPSARVVQLAMEMGFRRQPLLPERVGNDGFIQAVRRWHLQPRR